MTTTIGSRLGIALLALAPAALAARPPDAPPSARIVSVPGTGVSFAAWDLGGGAGVEHRVAISKDGGANWFPSERIEFDIPLRAGPLVPGVAAPSIPFTLRAEPRGSLYIVQFRTKGLVAWRSALTAMGVTLLWYLPKNAWIARMDPSLVGAVASAPFVRWVGPYAPGYRIDPELLAEIEDARSGVAPRRVHLATFTPGPEEKAELAAEVRAIGGEVVRQIPDGYLLDAMLTPTQIEAIARSTHLAWVDRWSAPEVDMDIVRQQGGADFVQSLSGGYTGQGVRGEVMDCGIMSAHPDHDGMQPHGPPPSECDHGTCTYGIVFGNGDLDGDGDAKATGLLPRAQGFFYDYNNLVNRYQEVGELVRSPYFAVFQSNSWGNDQTMQYDSFSQEMDDVIWKNDIAIFQSQSNTASRYSRPQAWAKNVVSVGAIKHYDTPTLGDDCWCAGASIGPAADGRIKPDLAFWYDAIYTTDLEPGGYAEGLYLPDFGGTSAATPAVAGIAGLFYEMWADNLLANDPQGTTVFERRPHAITMKALLINTADQYPFSGTGSDLTRVHQGWGLPSARNLYDRAPRMRVVDETVALEELQSQTYVAQVQPGQDALRVTMAYMDRAGTTSSSLHRINDVSLAVTDPAGTTVYYGNVGLDSGNWSTPGGSPNHVDTVENVFVPDPAPGGWQIVVSADDVNMDEHTETAAIDQDYALVVSGVTELAPVTPCGGGAAHLVARYRFDDLDDLGRDDSGNGHDGVFGPDMPLHGIVSGVTSAFGAKFGEALDFLAGNDVDEFTVPPSPDFELLGGMTGMAWIRPRGAQQSTDDDSSCPEGTIFTEGGNYWLRISKWNDGVELRNSGSGAPGQTLVAPAPIPHDGGTWTHVAFTRSPDGHGVRLYVNGSPVGAGVIGEAPVSSSARLSVGNYGPVDDPGACEFDGDIDEIEIFDSCMSDQAVLDEYRLVHDRKEFHAPVGTAPIDAHPVAGGQPRAPRMRPPRGSPD